MADDVARLGRFVRERRRELDLTQLDVSAAGGPSNTTLTGIEAGTRDVLSSATLRKLDSALRWAPGSSRAILGGGEPVEVTGAMPYVGAPGPGAAEDASNEAILRAMHDMSDAIREMSERLERLEGRSEN